jgi:putative flippase GtrA
MQRKHQRFANPALFLNRHKQFVRYGLIGITGASIDFLLFAVLSNHMFYLSANIISVSVGITNNFTLNTLFNFKVKSKFLIRFLSFYSIGLFGLLISSLLLTVLVSNLGLNHLLSKLITMGAVVAFQYYLNSRLTFRTIN